jgi:nucleotide-binding universal stress UspA family protein
VAKASEQVAESVAAILRESHPGLTIDVSAVPGAPAEALLRKAGELDADVIVVGNNNIKGVSRVLGSVARKVASGARCDLYIANTTY